MITVALTRADWERVLDLVKRGYEDTGDGRYYSVKEDATRKGLFVDKDAKLAMRAAERLARQVRSVEYKETNDGH